MFFIKYVYGPALSPFNVAVEKVSPKGFNQKVPPVAAGRAGTCGQTGTARHARAEHTLSAGRPKGWSGDTGKKTKKKTKKLVLAREPADLP
jgi:hypothetical protein